jgi:hypothetical protein
MTLQSLGLSAIYFVFTDGSRISFETDVIDMDIPALVGLTLLSEAGADIFVQQMKLVSPSWSADLVFMHGHLYVSKPSSKSIQTPEVFYSRRTLEDIHKKLGHAAAIPIERFLKLAKPDSMSDEDRALLREVIEQCGVCEKFGPRPRQVRASIPAKVVFKHEVSMNVLYLHGYPAIAVVCMATSFVASYVLESRRSATIWDTFNRIWCYS